MKKSDFSSLKNIKNKIDNILKSKTFLQFLLVLGFLILIYPLISSKYYSIKQNNQARDYEKYVDSMDMKEKEKIFNQAVSFNYGLYQSGSSLFDSNKSKYISDSIKNGKYPDFFKRDEPIGIINVPKVKIKIPIYTGVSESILDKGTGYMVESSIPVGGYSTHSIITGHRGLPKARMFRDLGELKKGDLFYIDILGKKIAYRVEDTFIVLPTDSSKLGIYDNKDYCTLLTCDPYMINSHRLLVRGHRVPYDFKVKKEMQKQAHDNWLRLLFNKYKEYIIGIIIFVVLALIMNYIDRRKKLKRKLKKKRLEKTKK